MKPLIAACLLLVGSIASAKCINVRQEISGVVVDSNGQPVEGAVVVASWLERGEPRTKTEQSGSQGRFTVLIIFDAYSGSGFRGEDKYEGKFERFSLGASKSGYIDALQPMRTSANAINTKLQLRKVNEHG